MLNKSQNSSEILNTKEMIARLKKEVNVKTDLELASAAGTTVRRILNWKQRKGLPTDELLMLHRRTPIDLHYVLTGEKRTILCPPEKHITDINNEITTPINHSFVVNNKQYTSEQLVDTLSFKTNWIKYSLGIIPENLLLIKVLGNNMQPWLFDGDFVIVDRFAKTTINGGCMAFIYKDGTIAIRRIFRNPDGTIYTKCDSDTCLPETIDPSDPNSEPAILGRVVRRVVQ